VSTAYLQETWYQYDHYIPVNHWWYEKFRISRSPSGTTTAPTGITTEVSSWAGQTFGYNSWHIYYQTWVPDRYETVSSGYWQPQEPVWIQTGVSGQISCCFISIADVMIGANYISRPLIC
jgi:hypothetical protein